MTQRRGRFLARIRVNGRLKSLGTCETRDAADRLVSAAAAQLNSGKVEHVGGESLRSVAERYLDRRELEGVRNIANDRNRFKCRIAPSWIADMPVKVTEARDVRRWVEELSKSRALDRKHHRKLSRESVKHCLNLLRGCFQFAIEEGLIEQNPAKDIKIRSSEDTGEKWTFLSLQEQRLVASSSEIPEWLRSLTLFAIYTGLRQSEQWSLKLKDVNLEDASGPHVIVRYGAAGRATKSNKVRRVPLIPEAVQVVRDWLELLPRYASENTFGLLFPTLRGCRRDRGKTYGFKKYLVKVGIKRNVRWHDLRHTCASSLAAGWWGKPWRLEEIRDMLGHSSVDVTERYAHLASSVIQEAAGLTPGLRLKQMRSKRDPNGVKSAKVQAKFSPSGAVGPRMSGCRSPEWARRQQMPDTNPAACASYQQSAPRPSRAHGHLRERGSRACSALAVRRANA